MALNIQIKMIKKDDGDYAVNFMGEEVISLCESVYKTDGDKIYEALCNMFAKGFEFGVKAERNGFSGASISEE